MARALVQLEQKPEFSPPMNPHPKKKDTEEKNANKWEDYVCSEE